MSTVEIALLSCGLLAAALIAVLLLFTLTLHELRALRNEITQWRADDKPASESEAAKQSETVADEPSVSKPLLAEAAQFRAVFHSALQPDADEALRRKLAIYRAAVSGQEPKR